MHRIDCDIHPALPGLRALLPYLDPHWRESVVSRGIEELVSLSYPPNAPTTVRAGWDRGADLDRVRAEALDGFGTTVAIANCLYGIQLPFSEDMGAAFARALNQYVAREWLDREPRLRASIVVPPQSAELAVAEIERCAADPRFVQVLLLVSGELPPGRRAHWPIYEAAARHRLPVAFHAGSSYRHAPTPVGWPSTLLEDSAAQAVAFQTALTSLVCEGVFQKIPALTVVMLESGVTWLPAHLWRLDKFWRGLRTEIPWVDAPPSEIVRRHVRFSLQPFDAPDDATTVGRLLEHLRSEEMLLFSTDYPHWRFDGADAIPRGMPEAAIRRMLWDNPLETYPRLRESLA